MRATADASGRRGVSTTRKLFESTPAQHTAESEPWSARCEYDAIRHVLRLECPTLSPLTHLQRPEAISIHILREVVAEAERPVMLYSEVRHFDPSSTPSIAIESST